MPHFIINSGTHCEGGVCTSSNDKNQDGSPVVIESKHALDQLFPSKFTICTNPMAVPPSPAEPVEQDNKPVGVEQFGPAVTSEFTGAKEAGLEIRKRSGWYRVFSAETKQLVHPDAEQKGKVEAVIADLITAFIEGS